MPHVAGMPVGAVVAFAGYVGAPVAIPDAPPDDGASPPAGFGTDHIEGYGWMVCDGRKLYCWAYPQLFLALGFLYSQPGDPYGPQDTYNAQVIAGLPEDAMFRVPDYRGYFLRMVNGSGQAVPPDPDTGERFMPYDPGTPDDGVGSVQEDALQIHQHGYRLANMTGITDTQGAPTVIPPATDNELTSTPTDQVGSVPGDVRVSTETRPKNIYVYYLIKYI